MTAGKENLTVRCFAIVVCFAALFLCDVNLSFGEDKAAKACNILSQYMANYYEAYQASKHKTDPQKVANLRAGVEHRLMDLGVQAEVFVALARYEFACRACFYLGWDSECEQIPHYAATVVKLAGCVE
jgi:hypothetical protein